MGEPATEMDSAKASIGLNLNWVEKNHGFRLWIEVKTIVQKPAVDSLNGRDLERSTSGGQQPFDERKKQGNLSLVVIWKVRVVHWEETSEEET